MVFLTGDSDIIEQVNRADLDSILYTCKCHITYKAATCSLINHIHIMQNVNTANNKRQLF